MKKTNFWKGLALAAVALVGVYTTSCSEEELKIQGGTITIPEVTVPELAEPVINVAITVLDIENYEILKSETQKIDNINMGKSVAIKCPTFEGQSEYTSAKDININIPTIGKGQAIVIPVTFYVVSLQSAVKDAMEEIMEELDGSLPVAPGVDAEEDELEVAATGNLPISEDGVIENETEVAHEIEISIPYLSGYEFRNAEEQTEGRAISLDDIKRLKPVQKIHKQTITILPATIVTINATQEKTPLLLTIDGTEYPLWFYEDLKVEIEQTSISHGGGHGHGHGNGNNTGGGTADAE